LIIEAAQVSNAVFTPSEKAANGLTDSASRPAHQSSTRASVNGFIYVDFAHAGERGIGNLASQEIVKVYGLEI
jgi:hypothetical protein